MNKNLDKMHSKRKKLFIFCTVILSILVINFIINIVRILFVDKLYNIEVYKYPETVSIKYDNEERYSSINTYFVNTYLMEQYVYRIDKEKALDIINNPILIINIDEYSFCLSENNELVFSLPSQMIRKRSIIDKIFMIIFYNNKDYLYYSTKPKIEHYENAMAWFNVFETQE